MEKYEKDFARMPYEKKSALEKQFEDKLQIQNSRKKAENFRFEAAELPKAGQKTRYQWNVEAIRTLKKIEAENRLATMDDQKILSKYAGWGGIAEVFDEKNSA